MKRLFTNSREQHLQGNTTNLIKNLKNSTSTSSDQGHEWPQHRPEHFAEFDLPSPSLPGPRKARRPTKHTWQGRAGAEEEEQEGN